MDNTTVARSETGELADPRAELLAVIEMLGAAFGVPADQVADRLHRAGLCVTASSRSVGADVRLSRVHLDIMAEWKKRWAEEAAAPAAPAAETPALETPAA